MKTGIEGKPEREFQIRWTERIYRLHLTGIGNHAPPAAGVYEIVLFPPGAEDGEVVFVGWEGARGSVAARLREYFEKGVELEHAYFDAVSVSDAETDEDLMDLAWAVAQLKKPRLNDLKNQPHSGRYSDISYREL
jgi:hypothetical protein